ncbi:hypothetical protein [Microcoleus sp.]|uniref:hypothetical protein n=1 Tax=Microcoleus sp. TaxID=44472 RepID=UPI00352407B9
MSKIVQSVSTDFCYETGVFNPRRIGERVVDLLVGDRFYVWRLLGAIACTTLNL